MRRDEVQDRVGQEIGVSPWVEMPQARIDAFADVTEDWQFIHIDPEQAAATPFGGTVAHGFLTLSMLSMMAYAALPKMDEAQTSLNYGFDGVRFIAPVAAGARIRARFQLDGVEPRGADQVMLVLGVTVEIEGAEKPAIKAAWRVLYLF